MTEDLFGFIDPVGLVEEDSFPFGDPVNPLFDHYRNRADMPIDMYIGLTLLGERGREQFFERIRLMRIQHRLE
jgi:hypothetical protein